MPIFNYKAKEIIVKIVYYGPGLCGKTTSLQYLHQQTIQERKGELYFLATETDQTIYFELLPLHVGEMRNFSLRFQVYTVPGQVKYNNTRKAVLQGVDAIVFVADSQRSRQEANVISFKNLEYNLKGGYNILLKNIPLVYEYNKRDMPTILSIDELHQDVNPWRLPAFETVAIKGDGVLDAFETISSLALQNLEKRFQQLHEGEIKPSRKSAAPSPQPSQALSFFEREEGDEPATGAPLPESQEQGFFDDGGAYLPENDQQQIFSEDEHEKTPILLTDEEPEAEILGEDHIPEEPLFPGKNHKELSYADIVDIVYHEGDIIFEEGEPGSEMYFIEEGAVKIVGSYKDTRKVVALYKKGDFFGEMALFGGKIRSARAVAVGKTRLIPVTKDTLSSQIPKKPELALSLLDTLSDRIRHNTKTISKLANQNKEVLQHLQKARNVIQQLKEQNEFLRQKLDLAKKS